MEIKERGKGLIKEFKDFAMKGNVIDLAIGVIIGGAFNKIVSSLVSNIIMPIIGAIIGGVDFKDLSYTLREIPGKDPAVLEYGQFIQNVVDFLIITLSLFIFIKFLSKLNRKRENEKLAQQETKAKEPTKEELLLTEIRDTLKEISNKNT
ncbi:large-conductance mechanosensitive channel protein MscL [Clostridium isatidis]|uniref:Large-conductance mechanosensitive channel n=2 Tax=Eubacteriales TaxID=186802 RepID=A0A343JFL9_9CLOT|nr:large-conductance mechanosensitive channel protein MscL [Clostridium isatidis]ASW44327.1 large-conductance mechanosensitive channel [Clostridium isatidis]NLZ34153.1 large-conductance mechanosensitive channel protein MscL [Clostridiales bacterium]